MSEVALHSTSANCITCVPDYFIDKYMVEANGEYVKIYLYLLRCLGRTTNGFSVAQIADALDHTQRDIKKAFHYWESQGLLELEYDDCDELIGIFLKEPVAEPAAPVMPAAPSVISLSAPAPAMPVAQSIPKRTASKASKDTPLTDQNLKELLYVAEKLIGHTLSLDAVNRIIYWHDDLDLSWDLIEYIIEYSVDKGSSHINYMEKIAINYANKNIRTVEEAKMESNAFLSLSFVVKSAFGITGRNLGQGEIEFVNRWSKELGFSNEFITEACKRAVLKTGGVSFEYADSILKNWHAAGVSSAEDLLQIDAEHAKEVAMRFDPKTAAPKLKGLNNYRGREGVDFDALEQLLIETN